MNSNGQILSSVVAGQQRTFHGFVKIRVVHMVYLVSAVFFVVNYFVRNCNRRKVMKSYV